MQVNNLNTKRYYRKFMQKNLMKDFEQNYAILS